MDMHACMHEAMHVYVCVCVSKMMYGSEHVVDQSICEFTSLLIQRGQTCSKCALCFQHWIIILQCHGMFANFEEPFCRVRHHLLVLRWLTCRRLILSYALSTRDPRCLRATIYIYICTYIYIHIYTHKHTYIHTCIQSFIHALIHAHT